MIDQIKALFGLDDASLSDARPAIDPKLASAALLVQVMVADGQVRPEEEEKLLIVLRDHYAVSGDDVQQLAEAAKTAQNDAVDLYGFTSLIKRDMDELAPIIGNDFGGLEIARREEAIAGRSIRCAR